jgi:hypothetical protein
MSSKQQLYWYNQRQNELQTRQSIEFAELACYKQTTQSDCEAYGSRCNWTPTKLHYIPGVSYFLQAPCKQNSEWLHQLLNELDRYGRDLEVTGAASSVLFPHGFQPRNYSNAFFRLPKKLKSTTEKNIAMQRMILPDIDMDTVDAAFVDLVKHYQNSHQKVLWIHNIDTDMIHPLRYADIGTKLAILYFLSKVKQTNNDLEAIYAALTSQTPFFQKLEMVRKFAENQPMIETKLKDIATTYNASHSGGTKISWTLLVGFIAFLLVSPTSATTIPKGSQAEAAMNKYRDSTKQVTTSVNDYDSANVSNNVEMPLTTTATVSTKVEQLGNLVVSADDISIMLDENGNVYPDFQTLMDINNQLHQNTDATATEIATMLLVTRSALSLWKDGTVKPLETGLKLNNVPELLYAVLSNKELTKELKGPDGSFLIDQTLVNLEPRLAKLAAILQHNLVEKAKLNQPLEFFDIKYLNWFADKQIEDSLAHLTSSKLLVPQNTPLDTTIFKLVSKLIIYGDIRYLITELDIKNHDIFGSKFNGLVQDLTKLPRKLAQKTKDKAAHGNHSWLITNLIPEDRLEVLGALNTKDVATQREEILTSVIQKVYKYFVSQGYQPPSKLLKPTSPEWGVFDFNLESFREPEILNETDAKKQLDALLKNLFNLHTRLDYSVQLIQYKAIELYAENQSSIGIVYDSVFEKNPYEDYVKKAMEFFEAKQDTDDDKKQYAIAFNQARDRQVLKDMFDLFAAANDKYGVRRFMEFIVNHIAWIAGISGVFAATWATLGINLLNWVLQGVFTMFTNLGKLFSWTMSKKQQPTSIIQPCVEMQGDFAPNKVVYLKAEVEKRKTNNTLINSIPYVILDCHEGAKQGLSVNAAANQVFMAPATKASARTDLPQRQKFGAAIVSDISALCTKAEFEKALLRYNRMAQALGVADNDNDNNNNVNNVNVNTVRNSNVFIEPKPKPSRSGRAKTVMEEADEMRRNRSKSRGAR